MEVLDVDLAHLDERTLDAIYRLWRKDPIILFRRQSLTKGELVAYSDGFGELEHLVRKDMYSPLHPEVIYITGLKRPDGSALGGLGTYEVHWHHDQIYRQRPATGSIFYATEMPEGTGRTSWCNTALSYAALPDDLRARVEGRKSISKYGLKASHSFQRDFKDNKQVQAIHDKTPPAAHPMVLENPATGQRSLYIDPNKFCGIEGMAEAEARALADELFKHMLRDDFIYTHNWRTGDVILWDNARLWHRRAPDDKGPPRFAKRSEEHTSELQSLMRISYAV